jgi:subtilisin family serine protease
MAAAVGANKPRPDGRDVAIGVAPGATWVAAAAHISARINYVYFTAAAEWMLYRAQPHIVIYAMTIPQDVVDPMLERIFSAMKVAETVVFMAAGNHGPQRGRNYAPANFPRLQPFKVPAFSVGSIDRDGQISIFSARGPSAHDGKGPFPQVMAPGEDVTIAFPLTADGLIRNYGTSFAVGYAAGVAAILKQASPDSPPNEVEHVLKISARKLGETRPNNSTGWGVIDVPEALKELARRRTPANLVKESGW